MSNLEPLARLEADPVEHVLERVRQERTDRGRELQLYGLANDLEAVGGPRVSPLHGSGDRENLLVCWLAVNHDLHLQCWALVIGSVYLNRSPIRS